MIQVLSKGGDGLEEVLDACTNIDGSTEDPGFCDSILKGHTTVYAALSSMMPHMNYLSYTVV